MIIKIKNRNELMKVIFFICKNVNSKLSSAWLLMDITSKTVADLPHGEVSEVQIEYLDNYAEITMTLKDTRFSLLPPVRKQIKYQIKLD